MNREELLDKIRFHQGRIHEIDLEINDLNLVRQAHQESVEHYDSLAAEENEC